MVVPRKGVQMQGTGDGGRKVIRIVFWCFFVLADYHMAVGESGWIREWFVHKSGSRISQTTSVKYHLFPIILVANRPLIIN